MKTNKPKGWRLRGEQRRLLSSVHRQLQPGWILIIDSLAEKQPGFLSVTTRVIFWTENNSTKSCRQHWNGGQAFVPPNTFLSQWKDQGKREKWLAMFFVENNILVNPIRHHLHLHGWRMIMNYHKWCRCSVCAPRALSSDQIGRTATMSMSALPVIFIVNLKW